MGEEGISRGQSSAAYWCYGDKGDKVSEERAVGDAGRKHGRSDSHRSVGVQFRRTGGSALSRSAVLGRGCVWRGGRACQSTGIRVGRLNRLGAGSG